jgi:hypothetical protein
LHGAEAADKGEEAFFTGTGAFAEGRPGGFAGDRKVAFERESGARGFGLTEEDGALGTKTD